MRSLEGPCPGQRTAACRERGAKPGLLLVLCLRCVTVLLLQGVDPGHAAVNFSLPPEFHCLQMACQSSSSLLLQISARVSFSVLTATLRFTVSCTHSWRGDGIVLRSGPLGQAWLSSKLDSDWLCDLRQVT